MTPHSEKWFDAHPDFKTHYHGIITHEDCALLAIKLTPDHFLDYFRDDKIIIWKFENFMIEHSKCADCVAVVKAKSCT